MAAVEGSGLPEVCGTKAYADVRRDARAKTGIRLAMSGAHHYVRVSTTIFVRNPRQGPSSDSFDSLGLVWEIRLLPQAGGAGVCAEARP